MRKLKLTLLILLLSTFSINLFAETKSTTPVPYEDDEFPQGLKDLRRFEIITLGSLPFVIMDVGLTYSIIQHQKDNSVKITPFPTGEFNNKDNKIKDYPVIWISVGISAGVGLTDYIVNVVKRNKESKKLKYQNQINISSISEDPDAVKIKMPDGDEMQEAESIQEIDEVYDVETVTPEDAEAFITEGISE